MSTYARSAVVAVLVALAPGGCERDRTSAPPPVPPTPPPVPPAPPPAPWTGPQCGAEAAPRPERDAAPMCWVPPAEFMMGTAPEHAGLQDFAPRKVRISRGFYMDQYEVTVEQFVKFANEVGNRCPGLGPERHEDCLYDDEVNIRKRDVTLEVAAGRGRMPAAPYRRGAIAYCAWAGKTLPTEAQWALAAFHDPATGRDRLYPWGDEYRRGIMNCTENGEGCLDGYRGPIFVGTFPDDRSATGLVDMGGNAYEWVQDCYVREPPCAEPCVDPVVTEGCEAKDCTNDRNCVVVRGGSFVTAPIGTARRHSSLHDASDGFRCVAVRDFSPAG